MCVPKPGLAWLVAVAIVALVVFVAVEVPTSERAPTVGALPLEVGVVTLPNQGTYYPPCTRATLPIWWAAYLLTVNKTNITVHLTGAWHANRGTQVFTGVLTDDVDVGVLGTWITLVHCPKYSPPTPSPPPPALPLNGSIDQSVFVWPASHRIFVEFVSFSGADAVVVTQPFRATIP